MAKPMANEMLILSKTLSFQLSATNTAIVENIVEKIVKIDKIVNFRSYVVNINAKNEKKTAKAIDFMVPLDNES